MTSQELESLIDRCRKADRKSQREMYEHFYGMVFAVCQRYAGSAEEAKELTNDAFFKLFTKIDQYQAGSNFSGWLYRLARNTALDYYRVAINKPEMTAIHETFLGSDASSGMEMQVLAKIDLEMKLKLLQLLPPSYRAVFNLFAIEEFTHEEIAATLGISVGRLSPICRRPGPNCVCT